MRPPIDFLMSGGIGLELVYSFIIIFSSLMIYYATKDMYELSSYKGIKYFRQAFLFFALAYFFRYFIKFFLFIFNAQGIMEISQMFVGPISLFIFIYLSSMAVFYLLYSFMWKKWNHGRLTVLLFNILALLVAFIIIFSRTIGVYLILNLILLFIFIFVLIIAYKDYKKKKGKGLFVIYLLLSIFWVLNVIDILIPMFFEIYRLLIYLASISLFMIILYKVLKKSGE
jgi:hypothetical protein